MNNRLSEQVGERAVVKFMDRCFVLNLMIDEAFKNDIVFITNDRIAREWVKIQESLRVIHLEVSGSVVILSDHY